MTLLQSWPLSCTLDLSFTQLEDIFYPILFHIGNYMLNLDLQEYGNTKKDMDDYRRRTPPIENYDMNDILVTFQKNNCGIVLHLVPTTRDHYYIRSTMNIWWIENILVSMCRNKLDTPFKTVKPRNCGGHNLCTQVTCCAENIDSGHDENVSSMFKSVTKLSMVFKLFFWIASPVIVK